MTRVENKQETPQYKGNMHTREQKIYRVTLIGGITNIILLLAKFTAGILGNSAAMVADAVHSLSDFLTDIVVLAFVRLSNKPADKDHDYGHGKYETIATSVIGLALLGVAAMLGWNGMKQIVSVCRGEVLPSPGKIAFVAAIVSILLKEWVFRITKKVADEVCSPAVEANAWHHRSDAFSSIGTALGIGGAIILGDSWTVLDPIAALIVCILISATALRLLRQASGELLEESLPKETQDRIETLVYRDTLVSDIHHMHTRRIGNIIAIEMHLRLPGDISLTEAHRHTSVIEHSLREEFGAGTHIMLHVEPKK